MEFETFKEELLDHLRQILGEEKRICFQSVEKNNGIQEEAVVTPGGREADCPYHLSPGVFENWEMGKRNTGGDFQRDSSAKCTSGKGGRFFFG